MARPTSFLNLSHIPVPLILPFSWPVGAEEAAVVRVRVRSQLRTRHNPSSYALKVAEGVAKTTVWIFYNVLFVEQNIYIKLKILFYFGRGN